MLRQRHKHIHTYDKLIHVKTMNIHNQEEIPTRKRVVNPKCENSNEGGSPKIFIVLENDDCIECMGRCDD